MTRLRKTISYGLPLMVMGLLFSIVVSVFSQDFVGYIGMVTSNFDNTAKSDILILNLYDDPNLLLANGTAKIYTGDDPAYGRPIGLIATALSAQAQRTLVSITTEPLGPDYRVVRISQIEAPDDIAAMFSGLTLSDLDNSIGSVSTQVSGRGSRINDIRVQNADTLAVAGSVSGKVSAQQGYMDNIGSQNTALNAALDSINTKASGQTPMLTALIATSDSLYTLTNNVNNRIIIINTQFNTFDTHLRTQFDSIYSRLDAQNVLLTAVWNKIKPARMGCFLGGTPILMANGRLKAIEKVKVGDMIMAFDEQTVQLKQDKVKEFFKHEADEYLIINGRLKVTANHPVYSKGKWVEIGTLKIGDTLLSSKGKPVVITSIKKVAKKVSVYNLEVNPYHTYVAGGVVVHNKKPRQEVAAP